MLSVAYLAVQFPSPVEPYVEAEIATLRKRGVCVIPGSVRPRTKHAESSDTGDILVVQSFRAAVFLKAFWLLLRRGSRILDLLARVVVCGHESFRQRIKALAHTCLGVSYAAELESRDIDHIHVHHGYFASWVGLVAARLLGVNFSLTLHGSDLLLHGAYLDTKLQSCHFCLTVSDYNRRYILQHYPAIDARKVIVSRLGVQCPSKPDPVRNEFRPPLIRRSHEIRLVAVGRLHKVKDHAFLVRACAQLKARGLRVECLIAGDGPERATLESLIRRYDLENTVNLLGHVPRQQMDSLYDRADVVVLTSRSEGLPLVLMEAMARGTLVLAAGITGINELVMPGKTGFLYQAGSQGDFVARLLLIHSLQKKREQRHLVTLSAKERLDWVCHGARTFVRHNFNQQTNLESFCEIFLQQVAPRIRSLPHEDFVLQQI